MTRQIHRRTLVQYLVAGTAATMAPLLAHAQAWPSRPINVIVPFTAGSPADTVMRLMADSMRASLGQALVIENVPGASANIGTAKAARAAADGYNFVVGYWGNFVANPVVYAPLSFDVTKDFVPVGRMPGLPMFVVTRHDLPASSMKEFVAWLKDNPNKASQGTAGVGSAGHVMGLRFKQQTGVQYQFVPYRSTPPATQAVLAGEVDFIFNNPQTTISYLRAGKLKALAVLSPERSPLAPEVPTAEESGFKGLNFSTWLGVWAPRGAPAEAVEKFNAALVRAQQDPALRKQMEALGYDHQPASALTPAALGELQEQEIERWWPILKAANIKPDQS